MDEPVHCGQTVIKVGWERRLVFRLLRLEAVVLARMVGPIVGGVLVIEDYSELDAVYEDSAPTQSSLPHP